ncbi:hypothetical protein LTR56_005807 [Elasticomyces elasticus]|nr:hypothetical protein LTR22_019435 [Elasticomyces elasticus]KAK3651350.1 hypothetical protein LTR56_005807 [Elasticomyces elasticus]KAK4925738.1 hypothetical protein LTR49_007348 [Elasticomyces elasticus]KAK5765070.1 hypothetical protein LTS12_004848 [Elasticomyces elasticus]
MPTILTLSVDRSTLAGNPDSHALDTFADYRFEDPFLLAEALHAFGDDPPPRNINNQVVVDGNKRLAWVGDSVIDLILRSQCYYGPQSRGKASEGWYRSMTENKWLGGLGFAFQIDDHWIVSAWKRSVDLDNRQMTDTVEALIGAVWLDSVGNAEEVARIMCVMGLICPAEHRGPIRPPMVAESENALLVKIVRRHTII